jgi:SulP family sulfate permease
MIGQTMVNVKSGGAKRLSGISCSLFIMAFIVVASPVMEAIPLAALVGYVPSHPTPSPVAAVQ